VNGEFALPIFAAVCGDDQNNKKQDHASKTQEAVEQQLIVRLIHNFDVVRLQLVDIFGFKDEKFQ
jgi:hypothetical protein